MADPDEYEGNEQPPLDESDDFIDERLWGPQKTLTAEEQKQYDAWFIRQVEESLEYSKRPDAVYYEHEDVMKRMWEILEDRIAKAAKSRGLTES